MSAIKIKVGKEKAYYISLKNIKAFLLKIKFQITYKIKKIIQNKEITHEDISSNKGYDWAMLDSNY